MKSKGNIALLRIINSILHEEMRWIVRGEQSLFCYSEHICLKRLIQGRKYQGIITSVNTPASRPVTKSRRRHHSPSCRVARDLFEIVQSSEPHSAQAVEITVAVHLLW